MSDITEHSFRVGAVVGRSVSVLLRNILAFTVIALLMNLLLFAVMTLGAGGVVATFYGGGSGSDFAPVTVIGLVVVLFIAATSTYYITTGAVVFGTLQDLNGERASLGACLSRGFSKLVPIVLVGLLASLAMLAAGGLPALAGSYLLGGWGILLVFPLFIVLVALWVVIPVAVVESPGVIASLGRSLDLTRGERWKIFAVVLITGALQILAMVVIGVLAGILGAISIPLVPGILQFLANVLVMAFYAVVVAVTYHDLRVAKEGLDSDQIAAIFE